MTELTHQGDVSGNRGKANMDELIERLEKATGPDRELEGLVAKALGELSSEAWFMEANVYGEPVGDWTIGGYGNYSSPHIEPIMSSVDAALALVERKLPGWSYTLASHNTAQGNKPWADVASRAFIEGTASDKTDYAESTGATLPIAILIALLKALNSDSSNAP